MTLPFGTSNETGFNLPPSLLEEKPVQTPHFDDSASLTKWELSFFEANPHLRHFVRQVGNHESAEHVSVDSHRTLVTRIRPGVIWRYLLKVEGNTVIAVPGTSWGKILSNEALLKMEMSESYSELPALLKAPRVPRGPLPGNWNWFEALDADRSRTNEEAVFIRQPHACELDDYEACQARICAENLVVISRINGESYFWFLVGPHPTLEGGVTCEVRIVAALRAELEEFPREEKIAA